MFLSCHGWYRSTKCGIINTTQTHATMHHVIKYSLALVLNDTSKIDTIITTVEIQSISSATTDNL
jgi:hypothetical protein